MDLNQIKAYLCSSTNLWDLIYSKSGGFTGVISRYIFSNYQGIVYGVGYTNNCKDIEYKRLEDISQISTIRGSKYVEVSTDKILDLVKKDLELGKIVLFFGLPCHIDALKKFLEKEYNNLITVALVCNGCSRKEVWNNFYNKELNGIKSIIHSNIEGMKLQYQDGHITKIPLGEFYQKYYFKKEYYCNKCLSCTHKFPNIFSDFIIGDNFSNLRFRCNMVLCISEKSRKLLDECYELGELWIRDISYSEIIKSRMLFYNLSGKCMMNLERFKSEAKDDF